VAEGGLGEVRGLGRLILGEQLHVNRMPVHKEARHRSGWGRQPNVIADHRRIELLGLGVTRLTQPGGDGLSRDGILGLGGLL
jgi:hypothetical protein